MASKIKSILTTWLCAMVVMLSLGETRAGDFFAAVQLESGQIAAVTLESISDFYGASEYDASGYAVAPKTTVPATANFAQTSFREGFSKGGLAKLSKIAGQPIKTIDDLVGALELGLDGQLQRNQLYPAGTPLTFSG